MGQGSCLLLLPHPLQPSAHTQHTPAWWSFRVSHTYFNPRLKILTMCLAAKTPSTMAQQKAAITPKLIKTIEATSCWGTKQKCLLAFHSHCFRGCGDPQETSRQSRMLAHHPTGRPFSVAWVGRGCREGAPGACPTCSGQAKKLTPWVSEYPRKRRLRNQAAWLFHSETQKSVRPLISRSPTPILFTVELEAQRGEMVCPRSLARLWKSLCPSTPSTVTCPTPHDSEAPHNLTWPCITEEGDHTTYGLDVKDILQGLKSLKSINSVQSIRKNSSTKIAGTRLPYSLIMLGNRNFPNNVSPITRVILQSNEEVGISRCFQGRE